MTTPSGTIGLSDVNIELGFPSTSLITMNDAVVRNLADVGGSGTVISMNNLRGKSNRAIVPLTIASNTDNYDVFTAASASPSYIVGESDITLTINSGVIVGSPAVGAYALSVPSGFNPADTVTIINNGTIRGDGGNGGNGGPSSGPSGSQPGQPGTVGGNAVYINRPTVFTNNGNMWAGGGGGGGGRGANGVIFKTATYAQGGGGGGGGQGHAVSPGGVGGTASAPSPPAPGTPGGNGSAGGAGAGGAGGNDPASGTAPAALPGAGGGGFGANGANADNGAGGAAGFYIVGNSFVTYPATGSRLGRVG